MGAGAFAITRSEEAGDLNGGDGFRWQFYRQASLLAGHHHAPSGDRQFVANPQTLSRAAADHGALTNSAELVEQGRATKKRAIPDPDVTREQCGIGHHHIITDLAVVGDVA